MCLTKKQSKKNIEVGTVNGTHGLTGDITVISYTGNTERFLQYRRLLIGTHGKAGKEYTVESIRVHRLKNNKKKYIIKLKNIDSIDAAQELRGCTVAVFREDIALQTDEKLISDYMQCIVVKESDGKELGTIENYYDFSGQDTFGIINSAGKEILIPCESRLWNVPDVQTGMVILKDLHVEYCV